MNTHVASSAKPRRPRRIAADEAHAWARNLRLGNSLAKLVLSMLTLYVNGEGSCFAGIEALADDTELSPDTVRKRLAWLEQVGAIARFPQWIDASGRRNGDGRGKRTSDEIRLLLNADPDEIEARAKGNGDGDSDGSSTEISPRSQQGLNPEQESVSPPVALGQPSDSGKGLISEPEPESEDSPPTPPLGGMQAEDGRAKEESEASQVEGWREFKTAFEGDGDPIVRVSLAKQLFDALSPGERTQVTRAAEGLIAWRRRQKKPLAKPSAQTFIREIDAWPSWERHAPPLPMQRDPPVFVSEGSQAWQALRVVMAIRDDGEPIAHNIEGHGRGLMQPRAPAPAFLALAQFAPLELGEIDTSGWRIVESGSQQCGAWHEFIGAEPRNIFTGEVTQKNVLGRIVDWKVAIHGLRVPCEWPPRKDGSLCTGPPPFDPSELTEDFK